MQPPRVLYEFGDFVLDAGQQRLHRAGDTQAIPLTGKTYDTLVYFLEHAGEPLGKEALLRAIWPGVVVEENSLTQVISGLRQILGETRGENRYIATLPRKGYRFVASVRVRSAVPTAAPPARSRLGRRAHVGAAASVVLAVLAGAWLTATRAPEPAMQSLAVLPFKPLVAAERNEVLELGMAESLISYLARSSRREIRPLSAVRRFAAVDQDAVAAGRALDVDAVLEGLLQRAGDRLRVSVRLLRVDDGSQLWARTFEQPFTEIFAVQDAIVAQIADAIDEPAPRAAALRHDTENPEAFVLFASGSLAFSRLTEPSLHQAIEFFERAVALDSGYARAHAGLADAYMLLAVLGLRTPEDVHANARAAAETALRLDAGLAPAHVSLAQVLLVHDHDLDGARRELDRAVELDASYAPAYFYRGTLAMFRGDAEAALAALDRAMKLDPYRLATRAARGLALLHARRYDESIDSLREVLALDERFDLARGFLMRALLANGEYQEVLVEMRGRKLHGPGSQGFVAQALALSGRQEEARVELAQVLERARREHVPAYDVATIYAALDDVDNAFAWLERAVDDSATVGTIALEPEFEKLHSDPRFETLVARTRTSRAHPSAGKHPL